jgi:hypothetical protein
MAFDTRCYDLARIFLAETPNTQEQDKDSLAQAIQDAVENWFFEHEAKPLSASELTDLIRKGA